MNRSSALIIPLHSQQGTAIEFFPDELPSDFNDICDILSAEFAPLSSWHQTAVEYYRQGSVQEFELILKDIVDGLTTTSNIEFEFHYFANHMCCLFRS